MKTTLTFDDNDMGVLQAGLFELPYRVAAPLIEKINKQIQAAQIQASYEAAEKLKAEKQAFESDLVSR